MGYGRPPEPSTAAPPERLRFQRQKEILLFKNTTWSVFEVVWPGWDASEPASYQHFKKNPTKNNQTKNPHTSGSAEHKHQLMVFLVHQRRLHLSHTPFFYVLLLDHFEAPAMRFGIHHLHLKFNYIIKARIILVMYALWISVCSIHNNPAA